MIKHRYITKIVDIKTRTECESIGDGTGDSNAVFDVTGDTKLGNGRG